MSRKELIEILGEMHGKYLVWKAEKIVSGEYYKHQDKLKDKFYGRYADKILKILEFKEIQDNRKKNINKG